MVYFRTDDQKSGQPDPPPKSDGSELKAMLHRVDRQTKRFVRLRPDDRQQFFPFIGKVS